MYSSVSTIIAFIEIPSPTIISREIEVVELVDDEVDVVDVLLLVVVVSI